MAVTPTDEDNPSETSTSKSEDGSEPDPAPSPWFADRSVDVLLYKINRRQLEEAKPSLLKELDPDVLDHLVEVLLFGARYESGRAHKRQWVLGGRTIDENAQILSGEIGYFHEAHQVADVYDDDAKEWSTTLEPAAQTSRAPFVIDATTQMLAVLKGPGFEPNQPPAVFRALLNRGESDRDVPTTDWDVEPMLDEFEFVEWLRHADSVQKVTFTAKVPNPDGEERFQELNALMESIEASVVKTEIVARDPENGLKGVERQPWLRQFIAMAQRGYGYIKGRRLKDGVQQTFDQRKQLRKGHIKDLPDSWTEGRAALIQYVRDSRKDGD